MAEENKRFSLVVDLVAVFTTHTSICQTSQILCMENRYCTKLVPADLLRAMFRSYKKPAEANGLMQKQWIIFWRWNLFYYIL